MSIDGMPNNKMNWTKEMQTWDNLEAEVDILCADSIFILLIVILELQLYYVSWFLLRNYQFQMPQNIAAIHHLAELQDKYLGRWSYVDDENQNSCYQAPAILRRCICKIHEKHGKQWKKDPSHPYSNAAAAEMAARSVSMRPAK